MFCPACGTQLPESAKFCLECGVKLSSFAPAVAPEAATNTTALMGTAAALGASQPTVYDANAGRAIASAPAHPNLASGSGTLHETAGATAPRSSRTGTTAHGAQVFVDPGDDSVIVPMVGPSRRTLVVGAMGIALVSLAIGALGAWRAVKASRPQTTSAPPLPEQENAVALLEMPRMLTRAADPRTMHTGSGRTNGGHGFNAASAGNGASSTAASSAGNAAAVEHHGGATSSAGRSSATVNVAGASVGASPSETGSASATRAHAGSVATRTTLPSSNGPSRTSTGFTTASGASGRTRASNGSEDRAGSGSRGSSVSGIEGPGLSGPRAPARNGFVEGEETDATGTLDPAAFTFVYRHYRTQISSCHSMVTRGGQTVAGIMRVRVRIGTDGHVVRTNVVENGTNSAALATCVQNQIRTWRYPAPEGGEVEMEYRLGFGH